VKSTPRDLRGPDGPRQHAPNYRGTDGLVPWPGLDPHGRPWTDNPAVRGELDSLARERGQIWMKLLEICGRRDPVNPTSLGAPPDGYWPEVEDAMSHMEAATGEGEIAALLREAFRAGFVNMRIPESACADLARDFWPFLDAARRT